MTKDEKYVKKYFPNAQFYPTQGDERYIVFVLDGDGSGYSLIHGPLSSRKMWSLGRKIMDKKMLDKLAD